MTIEQVRRRVIGMTLSEYTKKGKKSYSMRVEGSVDFGPGHTMLLLSQRMPKRFTDEQVRSLLEGDAVIQGGQIITLVKVKK